MNKVIDKGFRSCRFVSTIVKHPVISRIMNVDNLTEEMKEIPMSAEILRRRIIEMRKILSDNLMIE